MGLIKRFNHSAIQLTNQNSYLVDSGEMRKCLSCSDEFYLDFNSLGDISDTTTARDYNQYHYRGSDDYAATTARNYNGWM